MSVIRCIHRHTIRTHPTCFTKDGKRPREKWEPKPHWSEGKKIGFLDIETSDLEADFGYILSCYIKPEKSKEYDKWIITPDDVFSDEYDRSGVEQICQFIRKYDVIVTWYGARFDIPYIRTRAAMLRIDFPVYREIYHLDLWKTSRSKYKFRSNRLDNVVRKLSLPEQKTAVEPKYWNRVMRGDQEAIDYIAEHNKKDVNVLERVYKIFRPHMTYPRTSI